MLVSGCGVRAMWAQLTLCASAALDGRDTVVVMPTGELCLCRVCKWA